MTAPRLVLASLALLAAAPLAADPPGSALARSAASHVDRAVEDGLQPADYHHLLLALTWRAALPDWAQANALLDRLTAAGGDPLMADEVRLWRARQAVAEGRPAAARELFVAAGGLSRWWAAGPTPIEELADFPEVAQPPSAETAWRPAGGVDPMGWVRLAGLAWPARRQLLHLATTVHAEREQEVAVRLGAAQAARVWLNGRELLTTAWPLDEAEDQACGGGVLRPGPNLLAVAVAAESSDWWLRVRLTAADGSPLEGVHEVDLPPQPVPPLERPAPAARSLEGEIGAAVDRAVPGARLALAAYRSSRKPRPATDGTARAACVAGRDDGEAEARLLEWSLGGEPAAVQPLLDEILRLDPDSVPARIALARWLFDRGLADRADRVLAEADTEPSVRAARLDLEAERWGAVALPGLIALAAEAPRCVDAQLTLARRAVEDRRWEVVRAAVDRLRQLAPGLEEVLELAEGEATSCGDGEALRRSLSRRLELDPNQPELRLRLVRLATADDDLATARTLLLEGLGRCPDHPDLLLELARLEHGAGDDARAAALARQLLARRPQDRAALRLLEHLGGSDEDRSWVRPPAALRDLARVAPAAGAAVVLVDHHEVRFLPGNLVEQRVQRAILVRSADRAREQQEHQLAHVPERERLRLLTARVLRADGSELAARQTDTPRLSDPELNTYYDTRLRVIRFPTLTDGDILELAWVLSETAEANETGPYKGGIITLGDTVPTALAEVELAGPAETMPAWELVHLDAPPETTADADGTLHLRWRLVDLPALAPDLPPAPPLTVVPHLVYSSHPQWPALAGWYARHVAHRVQPSEQVAALARRLVEGVPDRRQRIALLYRFVTDEIRYVGLELGEHRFRPFSADWVLSHRLGDCKDKAALLVTLCQSVGIPAQMALIRIAPLGPTTSRLALLEAFNHAVVYLPEDDLWLDGTASGHDPDLPPAMDQGASALLVHPTAGRAVTTPSPGAGLSRRLYRLRPGDRPGAVAVEIEAEDSGEAADALRHALGGSSDPRRFATWVQGFLPGAEVVGEPTAALVAGRDPALLRLAATVPRSALLARGGLPTFPEGVDLVAGLTPVAGRRGPLQVPVRPRLEWVLEVELGRPPREPLAPVDLATTLGTLRLEVESRATGYRLQGQMQLSSGLLQPAEVGALRDLLVAAERHLGRPLEVP